MSDFNFGEQFEQPIMTQEAIFSYPINPQGVSVLTDAVEDILPSINRVQSLVLQSGATTFDVRNSDRMSCSSSAAVNISTITNGYDGQILTLIFEDANITLIHDATGAKNTINLGGSNYTSTANTTISLLFDGTSWLVETVGILSAVVGTIGGFNIGSDYIRDAANSMGLASTVTGGDDVRFWAGDTFANRAIAPFRVTEAGAVTASSMTITGGSVATTTLSGIIGLANQNIATQGWTQTSAFTVTDADTIAWGAGTFTTAAGTAYSITASNTGNMAAKTYVYLDINVSTTAYQTTTTAATAIGSGKVLVAICQNATGEATFMLLNNNSYNIDAANIVAGTVTSNEIAANTITGTNILTMNIAGKNATFDTGTIGGFSMSSTQLTATNFSVTSGAANTARTEVGTGSNIGGINSGNASGDIAFWAGSTHTNRATAPFRVTMGGALTATSATISGYVLTGKGAFGGDGSDGALSISSGTTTIDLSSAAVVVKNYTSISITGTGVLAFSNPNANGSYVILKSQGAVTLTSSATPMIDGSALGAAGGAAVTDAVNVSTPGNVGSSGLQNLFKTNNGTGATTAPAVGTGGAVASFLYSNISQVLNKYPNAFPGAGGGSGWALNGGAGTTTSGAGGRGGGTLIIECAGAWNFTTASGISVGGANGGNATQSGGATGAGGGGGGGGGYCLAMYNTLTANTGTITVSGGTGGNMATGTGSTRHGGGGGASAITAGSNGTSNSVDGTKTGGDGGTGFSSVIQNTLFA